ncbi:hypothetical protein Tco_0837921, partial [Tanacetum coccineum]
DYEEGALSPKGRGSGNGVKEKNSSSTNVPSKDKDHVSISFGTLEWTPLRCSSCKVYGHVLDECPKKIVLDVLKSLNNPQQVVRGGPNGTSSSGTKKQAELTRQEVSNSNPFDALNTVKNDDDLGMNRGNSKLAEKGVNFDVVSSEAFGSPTTTPLAERISDLERQMMDGKLVLVDDDGKPIKNVDDPVNANSDSEVDEAFNETASFMASTKTYDKDLYDDDEFDDLTDAQLKFANTIDINLRGFMESSNKLNKGDGLVGSIDKDVVDVRMMRLKGQDHSSTSMSQDKVTGFNVATGVTFGSFPTLAEVMGSQSKRVSNKPGVTSMKLRSGKFIGSLPASAATTLGESRVMDAVTSKVNDIDNVSDSREATIQDVHTITKGATDSNPYSFDAAENILMNDQGVGAVSTHNHVVGGLNSNRELGHEAFNTMPSVEVVAEFFGVSLKTPVDIDNFTRDIEKGIYEVWSKLTRE